MLAKAGIACAPVNKAEDIINDEHVKNRNMIVEIPRSDGVEQPMMVPGNPIKLSKMQEGPETLCRGSASTPQRSSPRNWASTTTNSPSSGATE